MADGDPASPRLLFQEAKDLLSRSVAAGGRIDDKASNLVTFNSMALGLVATALAVASPSSPAALAAAWVGPLLLLGSTACAIHAYRPMEYIVGISAPDLEAALSYDTSEGDLLHAAICAYRRGIEQNDARLRVKVTWVRCSLWLLALGLAGSVCSAAFIMPLHRWGGP